MNYPRSEKATSNGIADSAAPSGTGRDGNGAAKIELVPKSWSGHQHTLVAAG